MEQINQYVLAIDKVDVAIIGVCPSYRPRIRERKPIPAVLKTGLTFDYDRFLYLEGMLAAKVRVEFSVGNSFALLRRRLSVCLGLVLFSHLHVIVLFFVLHRLDFIGFCRWLFLRRLHVFWGRFRRSRFRLFLLWLLLRRLRIVARVLRIHVYREA